MPGLFVAAPASHRGIGRIGGIRQRAPPRPRGCPRGAGHPLQRGRAGMEPLKGNLLLRRGLGLLPCSSPTPFWAVCLDTWKKLEGGLGAGLDLWRLGSGLG